MTKTTEPLEMAEPKIEGEAEKKFIRRVIEIGKKFDAQRERIEASPYLTEAGRQKELEALRQTSDAELGAFDDETEKSIEQRITSALAIVGKATAPPEPEGDGIKAALAEATRQNLHSEIRRQIDALGLDTLGLEQAYLLASSPEVRQAMEQAPPRLVKTENGCRWDRWVSEERIEQTRMGIAASKHPEVVEHLRVLRNQRTTARHFSGVLRQGMRKAVPLMSSETRLRDLDGNDVTPARI